MHVAPIRHTLVSIVAVSGLGLSGHAGVEFIYARLVPGAGIEANGASGDVDVSADGRTVVFSSSATNWSSVGPTYNGDRAVAVDLDTGVIEELSVSGTGHSAAKPRSYPATDATSRS